MAAWGLRLTNLTISTVMSRLVGILPAAFVFQNIPDGIDKSGIISIEVTNVSHRRKFQKIVLD
tara:strand:- start:1401 stop:1589 length:189 start_codon:yes stop_codon:yes gene_type:complete